MIFEYARAALERRRVAVVQLVSRNLLESAELTELRSVFDDMVDMLYYRLESHVLSEVIQRDVVVHEVRGVPLNWWQAWKELYAPEWYLRRWPVTRHQAREFRVDLTRWALYPRENLPVRPSVLGEPVIMEEYHARDETRYPR